VICDADYDFDHAVDETLIAEAGRRLAAAAPDAQVILFGSHARGEATPSSDVDFLVVEPEVANEARESVRLHRTLRDLRMPADVIVVSRDYAERWREVRGGLVHAALSGGPRSRGMSGKPDLPGDLLALAREDLAAGGGKVLKAAIASRGQEFLFTHDIGLLLQLCQDAGLEIPADLAEADGLTPYAAAIRYGLGDPGAVATSDALRWAALGVQWVEAMLRSDS
jgi:predicted nucleotidyltransferase